MVYGDFITDEVTEDQICNPKGIYGALKYAGEKIVIAYNQVFDLNYTIIRPSALYGERCISRRVGQIFIENALQNLPLTIEGDGQDKLDFTYINDLMKGIELVINNKKSYNNIFNITYGSSKKIIELTNILRNFFDIKLEFKNKDKLMPKRGTLSIQKAKKILNFEPEWDIKRGYSNYIRWYIDTYKELSNH